MFMAKNNNSSKDFATSRTRFWLANNTSLYPVQANSFGYEVDVFLKRFHVTNLVKQGIHIWG